VDTALNDLVYALAGGGYLCPVGASSCTTGTTPPPTPTPEPATLLVLMPGLAAVGWMRRRRR